MDSEAAITRAALAGRRAPQPPPERALFHFYAVDEDRSWGWSNHVYSMGYLGSGVGRTPAEAFEAACEAPEATDDRIPDEYQDGEGVKAVRTDAESWVHQS